MLVCGHSLLFVSLCYFVDSLTTESYDNSTTIFDWPSNVEEGGFIPISSSLLEEWSETNWRNEKVMKKPPTTDRYIINKPPGQKQPTTTTRSPPTTDREVTETDLFLLGAIEKLAYRLDFVEKRLKTTEDLVYKLVANTNIEEKQEMCPDKFERHAGICYHISNKQVDWKSASSLCRSLNSVLVELDDPNEKTVIESILLSNSKFHSKDFWTGGLNPGLIWIWSSSAKPVQQNNTNIPDVPGQGRCLTLSHDTSGRRYFYRGKDCSLRHLFICEYIDNTTGRMLEILSRANLQTTSAASQTAE